MKGGIFPVGPVTSDVRWLNGPGSIQVPLPVLGVINGVREAFHSLCIATGLQVLEAMMEADREALCGPKGRHQVERPAWRGGSVDSQVTLGGRQVEVPRVRVRSAEGEVPLASFQWAASTDPLDEHTLAAVAAGASTRRYAGTLDPVPAEVNERATSSSTVSRRFVALSTKRLHAFLSRPLGELALRVVCIDGKVFRDHCMVIALGIRADLAFDADVLFERHESDIHLGEGVEDGDNLTPRPAEPGEFADDQAVAALEDAQQHRRAAGTCHKTWKGTGDRLH